MVNRLRIPNDVKMLLVLQSFVVESARAYHLPEEHLVHLKLVSEEAFGHILKNSFAPGETDYIDVETEIDKLHFRLSFFDRGLPLDTAHLQEYRPGDDVQKLDTAGIEFFLIKQFANHVQWINHGKEGKEFRLLFELPNQDIISILQERKEEKKTAFSPDIRDIEIRLFRPDDAVQVSQTIYKTYGYTYPNEDMYYPERIIHLNESGDLVSIVAFDKKRQQLAGHYALEMESGGIIAESGQAVVAPEYRQMKLMEKMRDLLEKQARQLHLEGIVSQPVTTHVLSQRANARYAAKPTGIAIALVPQKLSFREINQSLSQRETCMTYFKVMRNRSRRVFLPQRHSEMLKEIYQSLLLDLTHEKQSPEKPDKGLIKSTYAASWGFGVIKVSKLGKDNIPQLKQAIYNLLFHIKADVIFLYLPLEESFIDDLIDFIESEKFFFSGLVPSFLNRKDALRFEFLNGTIDISQINILEEKGQKIAQYVFDEKEKALR